MVIHLLLLLLFIARIEGEGKTYTSEHFGPIPSNVCYYFLKPSQGHAHAAFSVLIYNRYRII